MPHAALYLQYIKSMLGMEGGHFDRGSRKRKVCIIFLETITSFTGVFGRLG